jgi:hypothetical protein
VEIVTPQSLSKHIGPHILKELENVYQSWHWACEAHFGWNEIHPVEKNAAVEPRSFS